MTRRSTALTDEFAAPPPSVSALAPPSIPHPLCIDRLGLARMLGISERQVSRLSDAGKLPQALSLGGCKRWSIEEIEAWVRAGCPRRAQWENLRSVSSPDRPHGAGH